MRAGAADAADARPLRAARAAAVAIAAADARRHQHRRGAGRHRSPAPTTRRWATWSTPPRGSRRRRRPVAVLVGEITHALTADVIDYDEAASSSPRSRAAGHDVARAVDALAPPGRGNRRDGPPPRRPRARARARRRGACSSRSATSRGLLFNVLGESGVGKTRLVDELLVRSSTTSVAVLEGVCAPVRREQRVVPDRARPFSSHLGLDPSRVAVEDDPCERRAAKASSLFELPPDRRRGRPARRGVHPPARPPVARSTALDSPHVREAIHRSVSRRCSSGAARTGRWSCGSTTCTGPTRSWSTCSSTSSGASVASRSCSSRRCARRPTSCGRRAPTAATIVSLAVQPLSASESDELALELLGETLLDGAADQRMLGALFDRSGGNPLFLQELAVLVAEEGPTSELPGVAARAHRRPPRPAHPAASARCSTTPPRSASSGIVASLERFAAEDAPAVRPRRSSPARRDGLPRARRPALGVPQRLRPRGRVPDADQGVAGAAPRRRRRIDRAQHSPNALRRPRVPHRHRRRDRRRARIGRRWCRPSIRPTRSGYLTTAAERAHETGSHRSSCSHTTPRRRSPRWRRRARRGRADAAAPAARLGALIELHDYGVAPQPTCSAVLADAIDARRRRASRARPARCSAASTTSRATTSRHARELGRAVELLREDRRRRRSPRRCASAGSSSCSAAR